MTALPNAGISISLVKNTIGGTTYKLKDLCIHANVNKFARYKPVNGQWPNPNSNFGLTVPVYTWGTHQDWGYAKPTSEFRLGDFRGYDHAADIVIGLNSGNIPSKLNVQLGDGGIQLEKNFDLTNGIGLADLGLNGYYLGIELEASDGTRVAWTGPDAETIIIPTYTNSLFKILKWRGVRKFQLFLCNSPIVLGEPLQANTKKALPNCICNGIQYVDHGILNIVSESRVDFEVVGVKGDTSGGTFGFVDPETTVMSPAGDITLKVRVKSRTGYNIDLGSHDLEIAPNYFNDTSSWVDIYRYCYDANNMNKVSFIAGTSDTYFYIRLNNALNQDDGAASLPPEGARCEAGIKLKSNGEIVGLGFLSASTDGSGPEM